LLAIGAQDRVREESVTARLSHRTLAERWPLIRCHRFINGINGAHHRTGFSRQGDHMELTTPTLATLFEQLGLESNQASIDAFVSSHFLPENIKLSEADFWTPQQARFLKEELREDAEWALVVDELNERLHQAK
jgi:hypothetical protein